MCMESRYEALCQISRVSVPYMRYRLSGGGQEAYIPGADESLQEVLVQLSGNVQVRQIPLYQLPSLHNVRLVKYQHGSGT